MRRFHRKAALALVPLAALAGSFVISSPAMAAGSPIAACGGGSYHVIDHHNFGKAATVYLMWNGKTDCAVTWKNTRNSTFVNVELMSQHDYVWHRDPGHFQSYAGPVKTPGHDVYLRWGGTYGSTSWLSGWSHGD